MHKLLTLVVTSLMLVFATAATAQETAMIRVAHFSPDTPAVDVYVDGEVAIEALEYPYVTDFVELPVGTYSIAVSPAGTSLDDAAIGPVDLELGAGMTTVAAVGSLADGTLAPTVFTEELDDEPGFATVTVVHAIEGAPGVDVYGSGQLIIQNLRFADFPARDGAFTRGVPAGTYDIDVTVAENADAVLLEADEVSLAEGELYLVAAVGSEEDPRAVIVTPMGTVLLGFPEDEEGMDDAEMDDAEEETEAAEEEMADDEMMEGTALVRVAHFSPDTPAVDVYVNGDVAVEALEYPTVTGFLELPAGTYSIAVAPAGTSIDDAAIGPVDVDFAEGMTTVAAVGSLEDGTLAPTVFTEELDDEPGFATVTVVHAIEGAPGVDVYGSGQLIIQNLRFADFPARDGAFTRGVPEGTYDIDVTVAENADAVLLEADEISLSEGELYLIAAVGSEEEPAAVIVTPDGTVLLGFPEDE